MTTKDIEKAEIIICCKNGEKLIGVTYDIILLNFIAQYVKFIQIDENKDKSILDKFYFVGHRDSNDKPGEEIKITMDVFGNFSDLSWEMNHVRRSMMRLMSVERINHELLHSLEK